MMERLGDCKLRGLWRVLHLSLWHPKAPFKVLSRGRKWVLLYRYAGLLAGDAMGSLSSWLMYVVTPKVKRIVGKATNDDTHPRVGTRWRSTWASGDASCVGCAVKWGNFVSWFRRRTAMACSWKCTAAFSSSATGREWTPWDLNGYISAPFPCTSVFTVVKCFHVAL